MSKGRSIRLFLADGTPGGIITAEIMNWTGHEQLIDGGILVPDGAGRRYFQQDYAFRSPSAASGVIVGRPDNGRTSWRLKGTDKTYATWQEEQVAAVAPQGGDE